MQTEQLVTFPQALRNAADFLRYADLVVATEKDAGDVSDCRQEIKEKLKEIEKTRKSFTEPMLEAKRRIDDEAKRISAPWEAIVRSLDQKLIAWHRSQEEIRIAQEKKRREEEMLKLEAQRQADLELAMATGDEKAAENVVEIEKNLERLETKPIEINNATRTGYATTYLQERWTFEVVDAKLVPRDFLVVDETKLQKYATANKETAAVPGVRFFQKAQIGGRR
jgi:hypothetical protein